MTDAQVGRLLVAAVHQAIVDELPARIDFYEHWLRGERLRDGGVGLAPMIAVLGFLRAEGEPYHDVMRRAGRYAAEWTRDAMPSLRRRMLLALPRWWRARAVLNVAVRAIRQGYAPTRAVVRGRRGRAGVEVRTSLFCRVREPQPQPLCGFHVALIQAMLAAFNLPATSRIERCAGAGGDACLITVELTAPVTTEAAA